MAAGYFAALTALLKERCRLAVAAYIRHMETDLAESKSAIDLLRTVIADDFYQKMVIAEILNTP